MDLSEIITSNHIKLDMSAATKEEALEELTDLLYDTGTLSNKEAFLADVYLREAEGMTGIGNNIAIPHGKSKFVKTTSVAFGLVKKGIPWETIDGEPVKFIVLFAVDENDKTSTHVRLLSTVAAKLANEETCSKLLEASSSDEILSIFKN